MIWLSTLLCVSPSFGDIGWAEAYMRKYYWRLLDLADCLCTFRNAITFGGNLTGQVSVFEA